MTKIWVPMLLDSETKASEANPALAGVPRTEYQSDAVHVVHQRGYGSTVFVTFNDMGMSAGRDRFWGAGLFAKLGLPAIGIVSTKANWFPPSRMPEPIAVARRLIEEFGYSRVIAYGFSQGAYAALRYSRDLGADRVVSLSPQCSIDPREQSFDRRYASFYENNKEPMLMDGSHVMGGSVVVFDPYDKHDLQHVDRIGSAVNILRVPCPFLGHHTIRVLSETKSAPAAMAVFVGSRNPDDLRQGLRSVVRVARRSSAHYWSGLGFAFRRRKMFASAIVAFRRAIEIGNGPISSSVGLAQSLITTGQHDEAKAVLSDAMKAADVPTDVLFHLCEAFRNIKAYPEAVEAAQRRVAMPSSKADTQLQLAACLVQAGRTDEAVKLLNSEIGLIRKQ